MHDPQTVAHEIKLPVYVPERRRSRFQPGALGWHSILTVWHVDPETDGTDDSCGWFKRARHGDETVLAKIVKELAFHWDRDRCSWFTAEGQPNAETLAIVHEIYLRAARVLFEGRWNDRTGWRRASRFVQANLSSILFTASNSMDGWQSFIEQRYGPDSDTRQERIERAASMVYGDLLRMTLPWYRHARWHVHHWKLQWHDVQQFKRWAFSRCRGCGRRFAYGESPYSIQWDGDGPGWFRNAEHVYHGNCANQVIDAGRPAVEAMEE